MQQKLRSGATRLRSLLSKAANGLMLTDAVLPWPITDVVQARLSLYEFFAAFTRGARVVELTAGSGFGAAHLARTGHPLSVTAFESNRRLAAYATKKFAQPNVKFESATAIDALSRIEPVDVIIVTEPAALGTPDAVARISQKLSANGKLLIAAPPLVAPGGEAPTPRAAADAWRRLLKQQFAVTNVYAQQPPANGSLDLASPDASRFQTRDFRIEQVHPSAFEKSWPLTTMYLATNDEKFARPKLHVGCGPQILAGWVNVDNQPYVGIDFIWDASRGLPFLDASHIFAEHFIEHLRFDDAVSFLRECRRVLADDGRVRLSTPNLDWVIKACYRREFWKDEREAVYDCMSANRAFRGWGHHYLYNAASLRMLFREAGFADVEFFDYGASNDPVLRNIERHEQYTDVPDLRHILIAEASGRSAEPSPYAEIMDEYRRDIAVV